MKRLLVTVLLAFVGSSALYAESCTEEQIAKMIRQNLSQATIDSICKKNENTSSSNDKQIIVNITNAPVNNNINTNTNTNTNTGNNAGEEKEHFFFRIGLGSFSDSGADFTEPSFNYGLHYYFDGLNENGFGVGFGGSAASKSSGLASYSENTAELELMYNVHLGGGFNLTPAFIAGSLTRTLKFNDVILAQGSAGLAGFGIYLTFPSVVKSGQGLSIFVKNLNIDTADDEIEQKISLAGVQFIW